MSMGLASMNTSNLVMHRVKVGGCYRVTKEGRDQYARLCDGCRIFMLVDIFFQSGEWDSNKVQRSSVACVRAVSSLHAVLSVLCYVHNPPLTTTIMDHSHPSSLRFFQAVWRSLHLLLRGKARVWREHA